MNKQVVIFELGAEQYGIDIAEVESIIKVQPITHLPQAPGFIEGVIHLRGKIIPIVDLHKRFGLPNHLVDKKSRIIVAHFSQNEVGMLVDAVSEVLTFPDECIENMPPLVSSVDSSFIEGIAKVDGRLIILLDLRQIFSVQERDDLQQTAGAKDAEFLAA